MPAATPATATKPLGFARIVAHDAAATSGSRSDGRTRDQSGDSRQRRRRRHREVAEPGHEVQRESRRGECDRDRERPQQDASCAVAREPACQPPERRDERCCKEEAQPAADPFALVEPAPAEALRDVEQRPVQDRRAETARKEVARRCDQLRPETECLCVPVAIRHERGDDRRRHGDHDRHQGRLPACHAFDPAWESCRLRRAAHSSSVPARSAGGP